jgi:hypothetical protein
MLMDLRTGVSTSVPVGGQLVFTSPNGLGLIGETTPGDPTVRRFNLNGSLEQTYPTSFADGGSVAYGFRESPDGTMILLTTKAGFELVDNAGKALRYIAPPAGYSSCWGPFSWDNSGITVACNGFPIPNGHAALQTALWRLSVSGGSPARLTAPGGYGPQGAWLVGSQLIIEEVACGTSWLSTVNADGTTTRLDIPGVPADGAVQGEGTYQDRLAITVRSGCANGQPNKSVPTESLDWYNPGTNTMSPLFTKPGWINGVEFWAAA